MNLWIIKVQCFKIDRKRTGIAGIYKLLVNIRELIIKNN